MSSSISSERPFMTFRFEDFLTASQVIVRISLVPKYQTRRLTSSSTVLRVTSDPRAVVPLIEVATSRRLDGVDELESILADNDGSSSALESTPRLAEL